VRDIVSPYQHDHHQPFHQFLRSTHIPRFNVSCVTCEALINETTFCLFNVTVVWVLLETNLHMFITICVFTISKALITNPASIGISVVLGT
jgi:hypothetical protein